MKQQHLNETRERAQSADLKYHKVLLTRQVVKKKEKEEEFKLTRKIKDGRLAFLNMKAQKRNTEELYRVEENKRSVRRERLKTLQFISKSKGKKEESDSDNFEEELEVLRRRRMEEELKMKG